MHRRSGVCAYLKVPIDNDVVKLEEYMQACEGEESNMVLMPRWEEESHDTCIKQLVDALLLTTDGMNSYTDLRPYSKPISSSIFKAAH